MPNGLKPIENFLMNKKRQGKILIGYATAGIGHKKASLAVKEALDKEWKSFAGH